MDGNKSVTANFKTWEAPIGIPIPSFGITQTYRMYDTEGSRNAALTYNLSPDAGYYTHYVDSTHGSATNTDNRYGSPSMPRSSPPPDLPSGVLLKSTTSRLPADGTSLPCLAKAHRLCRSSFAVLVHPAVASILDVGYYGNAAYIIVEGIKFANGAALGRQDGIVFENNHICIRGCEFTNSTGTSVTSWTDNGLSDIVFYSNVIHDNGIWDPNKAEGDQDYHGIGIGAKGTRIWAIR